MIWWYKYTKKTVILKKLFLARYTYFLTYMPFLVGLYKEISAPQLTFQKSKKGYLATGSKNYEGPYIFCFVTEWQKQ